jgi:hypothetical protein
VASGVSLHVSPVSRAFEVYSRPYVLNGGGSKDVLSNDDVTAGLSHHVFLVLRAFKVSCKY